MKLSIRDITGSSILAGAPSGRSLFAHLIDALPKDTDFPRAIFLDFDGIEVATASYLRESVLEFRDYTRGRKTPFYPVVANASPNVIDELIELVQPRADVLLSCKLDEEGKILRTQLIGVLEPMQRVTLELLSNLGEASASQLRDVGSDDIKTTAWNNRLAALCNLGLIAENSMGRTKLFRPLLSGGNHGY